MENDNSLEGRVWGSRFGYALETFSKANRDYWNMWTELTHSKKMHERLLGWVDKAIWPLFAAIAAPIIIPQYMINVKYSQEKSGYVPKNK